MEISLLKKNFSLKSKDIKTPYLTKVKLKPTHFLTINEIQICSRIKTTPYWFNYFNIVITNKLLKDVNNMADLINKEDCRAHLLLTYNNEHGDTTLTLKEVLLQCTSPKQVISRSIETYACILNSLLMLHNKEITFFDMSDDNIYFTEYSKPILAGFENSIFHKHLDETYMINIIKNIDDFTYKPLEIHLLFYLIINDEVSLSYALSYEICEHFIKNMPVLSLFSQSYRENFKKDCNDFLNKYINKSRSDIINDVIKYSDTWDNYSVSVLYLHIFATELQVFSLRETFVGELVSSLSKNLSVDPYKRETLPDALNNYTQLMHKHTDWAFVNKIPCERLYLLQKVL